MVERLNRGAVRCADRLRSLFTRWVGEECGQDIIEYALLAALIGTVGILAWQSIGIGVGNAYSGWDTGVQDLACPPDPGDPGSGGCVD